MKTGYILALVAFMFAMACAVIGAVQGQCTPLNQALGNCNDSTGWFVVAGVAGFVAIVLAISAQIVYAAREEKKS